MTRDLPLVSVIVITYKSARFVLDTLESVKRQTYPRLELIVSDDCSPDETLAICREWLDVKANRDRFVSTRIVSTPRNGGICANYNNSLGYAKGEWIKYIAGDDELLPNCIEEYMKATSKSDDRIFVAGTVPFNAEEGKLAPRIPSLSYLGFTAYEQETRLLEVGTVLEGPTIFLEATTLRRLGGFDMRYPFIEDYPLFMKYLSNGLRIGVVEKALVNYREYPESVSRSENSPFGSSILAAIEDASIAAWKKRQKYLNAYHWWCERQIRLNLRGNRKLGKLGAILSYLLRLTDPVGIRKHFQN